jgi:hypothetical protein
MPIVEQELLTLPENLISYPIFSGVRIAQSLAFCVVPIVEQEQTYENT